MLLVPPRPLMLATGCQLPRCMQDAQEQENGRTAEGLRLPPMSTESGHRRQALWVAITIITPWQV
jgi:hypothetical protein